MTDIEFKEAFVSKYGIDLDSALPNDGRYSESNKIKNYLERCVDLVEMKIADYNPFYNYEDMTERQVSFFNKAVIEQAYYMLNASDVTVMLGYDPVTNALVNIDELRRRYIAPMVERYLTRAGLLYRGLNRRKEDTLL